MQGRVPNEQKGVGIMTKFYFYGNSGSTRDIITSGVLATRALGVVLSTPVGVDALAQVRENMHYKKVHEDRYQTMLNSGKRPTKAREEERAKYEFWSGMEGAYREVLINLVVEKSDFKCDRRAARNAINFEIEALENMTWGTDECRTINAVESSCITLFYQ